MSLLKAPGSVVGVAVLPREMSGKLEACRYYISALAKTGDEYFTEIETAKSSSTLATPRAPGHANR
jgi:hypothetical protein